MSPRTELLAEGFEPWSVPEMYLANPNTPDVFVDISTTFERKLDALRKTRREPDDRPRRARRPHARLGTAPDV